MTERDSTSHLYRTEFAPVEEILNETLGRRHGARFAEYRSAYHATLSADHPDFVLPEFPQTVTLELVNRCNLTCVMCYTANHKGEKFSLDLGAIERLLAEGQQYGMPALLIGAGSEGLLYRDVREVVRAAKAADVMDFFLITNGTLLTPDLSEFLIDEGVSRVLISLDAATPETFEKVRGRDELGRIEQNVEALLDLKARKGSKLPIVRLSFCVQDINRHEQHAFYKKWFGKVDYLDFQVLSDFTFVGNLLTRSELERAVPAPSEGEKLFCHYPFGYLNVWANGDITPCCVFYGKNLVMGNVASHTLKQVWDGDKMQSLRQEFLSGRVNDTCRTCLLRRENLVSPIEAFAPTPTQV